MKYLSLFSGIGGFEKGIQQAYDEDVRERDSKEWTIVNAPPRCVGYSEINKYAIQVYEKRFPNHKNFGDITVLDPATLPDFDLICGGFPCQAFSIAGKRRGFDDTRGTLFFDIARILQVKRPRLLLLENVKGLLSHDNGRTFKTIISTLAELGYDLQWQVLNSKNFGVPQNRERVFIIGHLRGTSRPEVFPLREDDWGNDTQEGITSHCLTTDGEERYDPTAATYIANTIATQQNTPSRTQRRSHENLIAATLTGGGHSGGLHSDMTMIEQVGVRRLTPIECERLQGFPDGWTEGLSDSQRYKCLGNAVTVNVIEEITKRIIK